MALKGHLKMKIILKIQVSEEISTGCIQIWEAFSSLKKNNWLNLGTLFHEVF